MTTPAQTLIQRDALQRVRNPLEEAWTLPPVAYTSAQIFENERETLFSNGWLCVGRMEQFADVGDYRCIDLPAQPIVVVRGHDDEIRAFSRVCLHRAMPLAEGTGNATRFVCPYHNWTYELTGQLRSAPMMEGARGFDPKKCRLPMLAVEIWQGFVFVNVDPEAEPLATQLAELTTVIANYEFDQMVVVDTIEFDSPWNWKILVENFMEAYHHIGTHKTTFQPVYPARMSSIDDNNGKPWVLLRMPAKPEHVTEDSVFPKLQAEEKDQLLAICVFPTLLFAASATGAAWYQLEPSAHDQMTLRIHAMTTPATAEALDEASRIELMATLRTIHEEDIEANRGPWLGLNGALTTQGRLSAYEKAIWQLNQLWADALGLDSEPAKGT